MLTFPAATRTVQAACTCRRHLYCRTNRNVVKLAGERTATSASTKILQPIAAGSGGYRLNNYPIYCVSVSSFAGALPLTLVLATPALLISMSSLYSWTVAC